LQERERLKCVNCLRFFDSATALTQHAESQGVRCKIRDTDQYGTYVDEITASTAATAGRHADLTVKYVVNDFKPDSSAPQRVVDSNAAVLKAAEKAKAEYWTLNEPKW
jgi:hypothetical protein